MKKTITALIFIAASTAHAENNANMKISTNLNPSCDFNFTDINFGIYNPAIGSNATLVFNIKCSRTVGFGLFLNGGHSTNVVSRSMENTFGEQLQYNIYKNSDATGEILGNYHDGQVTYFRSVGSGQWYQWRFAAKAFTKQYVREAVYTDSITANLDF